MKFKRLLLGLTLSALTCASLAEESLPTNQLSPAVSELTTTLAKQLAPRLNRARYMESTGKVVTVPSWAGFPTVEYTYSVSDPALKTNKTARVILLDPEASRLALWMVNACLAAKGSVTTNDLKKLADNIIGQSGGQFPVRGIVYEDILPENGINEIYCFMDGVTVKVRGGGASEVNASQPPQKSKRL